MKRILSLIALLLLPAFSQAGFVQTWKINYSTVTEQSSFTAVGFFGVGEDTSTVNAYINSTGTVAGKEGQFEHIKGDGSGLTNVQASVTEYQVSPSTGIMDGVLPTGIQASSLTINSVGKPQIINDSIDNTKIGPCTLDPDVKASSIAINTVGLPQLSATGTRDSNNYLRGDNTWAEPAGGSGSSGISSCTATLLIAAVNASEKVKSVADYRCDGVNDEFQIQSALNSLIPNGGKIILSEGTFTINYPVYINSNGTWLTGCGWGTVLQPDASIGAYTDYGLVTTSAVTNGTFLENVKITDFTIDGRDAEIARIIHSVKIWYVKGLQISGMRFKNAMWFDICTQTGLTGLDAHVSDFDISSNHSYNANSGFMFIAYCSSGTIANNVIKKTGNQGFSFDKNCSKISVINNVVCDTTGAGFYAGGGNGNINIMGCTFSKCGIGIYFHQNTTSMSVVGCSILNSGTYGIDIHSSAGGYDNAVFLSGNNVVGSGTADLYDAGKNTVCYGNNFAFATPNINTAVNAPRPGLFGTDSFYQLYVSSGDKTWQRVGKP